MKRKKNEIPCVQCGSKGLMVQWVFRPSRGEKFKLVTCNSCKKLQPKWVS